MGKNHPERAADVAEINSVTQREVEQQVVKSQRQEHAKIQGHGAVGDLIAGIKRIRGPERHRQCQTAFRADAKVNGLINTGRQINGKYQIVVSKGPGRKGLAIASGLLNDFVTLTGKIFDFVQ